MQEEGQKAYRLEDLAVRWDMKPWTLQELLRRGDVQGFKVGRQWRILRSVVEAVERGEGSYRTEAEPATSADLRKAS